MNAITPSVRPEPASSAEQSRGVEDVSQEAFAVLRATLETELTGVIDRLITGAVTEADAAFERARAAGSVALEAAQIALEEQTRLVNGLTASLVQSESQVEELRSTLEVECANAEAARNAYEVERSARARADREAQTVRDQLVSDYESQLQAVHVELDAMRAAFTELAQQREAEACEQARLIAALKTVQHACALVDSQVDTSGPSMPAEKMHQGMSRTRDPLSAAPDDERTPQNAVADDAVQVRDDEAPSPTTMAARRGLKLVAPSEETPVAVPPHLVEYLKELFEQINTMYLADAQAYEAANVLDRLSDNLRYARDVFVQRASFEGVMGAELFEQELFARLDELGATSLGRHLAIAAYELTRARKTHVRAEAS